MTAQTFRLVVVNAGVSDPSSTRLLADRAAQRVVSLAAERGNQVLVQTIDLRELLPELPAALSSQLLGKKFTAAIEALAKADALVAAAPVYKAGASGLFTSFFQVLDNDLLIGKPVILAATAGTARHALVVDEEMRSLFAYLRTLPVPTSLFASTEDWNDKALGERVDRAAFESVLLMESGFAEQGARRVVEALPARIRFRWRDATRTSTSAATSCGSRKAAQCGAKGRTMSDGSPQTRCHAQRLREPLRDSLRRRTGGLRGVSRQRHLHGLHPHRNPAGVRGQGHGARTGCGGAGRRRGKGPHDRSRMPVRREVPATKRRAWRRHRVAG